jgi:3-dehydroquinate synthase
VGLGIVAACTISVKRAGLKPEQRGAIIDLLAGLGLPTRLPRNFGRREILTAVKFDKKFESGEVRFVVTPRIGVAHVADNVTIADIREAIDAL